VGGLLMEWVMRQQFRKCLTVWLAFNALLVPLRSGAQAVDLPDISLAEESTIADQPTPKIGTKQEFVGPIATLHCSKWEVTAVHQEGFLVSQCENFKMFLKEDQSLNLHKVVAGKETALVFEPAYPVIEFPLQVGKHPPWKVCAGKAM
jgi:hypothetical protein